MGPVGGSGGGGLGHASFTLAVDAGSFNKELEKAGTTAKRVSDQIGKDLSKGSSDAARGLLQLSYAIDDVQYGFHSIVNNIPQIVMGLGLGPGMTGVISILAVAANQLIEHWDGLSSIWDSSANKLPTLRTSISGLTEDLKKLESTIEGLEKSTKEGHWFGPKENLSDVARLKKLKKLHEEGTKDLKDKKLLEQFGPEHTKETEENAASFQKAVKSLPQGADTIISRLTEKLSPKEAQAVLASALRGDVTSMEQISKAIPGGATGFALKEALPDVREQHKIKREEDKQAEEVSKDFEENARKLAKKEAEKKIADMEEQKHQIERQKTALTDQAHEIRHPERYKGTQAFAEGIQQHAGQSPQKMLLKEAKDLNKKIDKLTEEIRKSNNVARFGA